MSDQGTAVGVGAAGAGAGGVGAGMADVGGVGAVGEIASVGVGAADVGAVSAVGEVASVGVRAADVGTVAVGVGDAVGILAVFADVVGILGTAVLTVLGFLGEVLVGVVIGGGIFGGGFLLLLGVVGIVSEVGGRRAAQVPAHLRAVPALAPKTLRWVRGLLPGYEGAAWLAEVTSCLAETTDKGERRRYLRSYRRGVPQLIWTSWTERLSASSSQELS